MIIKYQVADNDTESVKAKLTFEREAQIQVLVIKVYHNDNRILNASEFMCCTLSSKQSATILIPRIWVRYQVNPGNLPKVYQW